MMKSKQVNKQCALTRHFDLLAALGQGVDVGEQRGQAGGDKWRFVLGPVQTAPPGEGRQWLPARNLLMEGTIRIPRQDLHLHPHRE